MTMDFGEGTKQALREFLAEEGYAKFISIQACLHTDRSHGEVEPCPNCEAHGFTVVHHGKSETGEAQAEAATPIRCHACGREQQASENFPFLDDERYCWPCFHLVSEKEHEEWVKLEEQAEPEPASYPAPTEPGWYWARLFNTPKFDVVRVACVEGLGSVWQLGYPDSYSLKDFDAWGPRVPEWKGKA